MNRLIKNLRRASRYIPDKVPKCLSCGQRREWMGLLPGAAPRGSLIDENFKAGLCSWECFHRFYGLFNDGQPCCRCGNTDIRTAGAKCIDCQRQNPNMINETDEFVFMGEARYRTLVQAT